MWTLRANRSWPWWAGARGEFVEQATADTATAVGGHHGDDELGDRRAVGRHDQRGLPHAPPGRTDRTTGVVEREQARPG
jgi:hypothetical protein